MKLLPPVVGVCSNPMLGMKPGDMMPVAVGVQIQSLAPKTENALICRLNGEWLLREDWDIFTRPGDVIEWYDMPGREATRYLLQIALIAAVLTGQIEFVPYLVAANAAYNLLVPPRLPDTSRQVPGSVYSTQLAGNAARLDEPIWRQCGRVKITPPFAAQPYTEFLPSDIGTPELDRDQYYYVVFAIGVGNYEVEKALIGKTSIYHFADVLRADYLPPGTQPSEALCNIVTSDEVSGSELEERRYVGGFATCRPGDKVTRIAIDVTAYNGLMGPGTAEWQVEVREINDYGAPVSDWALIAVESRTADTTTRQRWTNWYTLSAPIRAEVRVARTNVKSTDPNVVDAIQWIGLRAELERAAPLNADTAHYEVVMRASEQLSGFSQQDFSLIVRGFVRTWDPNTGWGAEVFTRNAAWWLADLWTNPIWGEGMAEDRVDLQGLYDWSLTLDARQDRFDYSFNTARDSWEAAQLIASSGRARAFRRNGVYTISRDELVSLPVSALTHRNTQPGSMRMRANLPTREQADGVIAEYLSNVTWDTKTIECPCPGESVPLSNPVFLRFDGVTGAFHCEREGLYQAADMALRRTYVSATTEMEGALVAFLDPVRWQPQIRGYGQAGDVAFWDPATLVMGLTEPPDFTGAQLYLTLQRDDNSLTTPVVVTAGPTANDVTLPAAPDFAIVLDDNTRERPKYILGPLATSDELVKVSSITDGGKEDGAQLFDIEAVVDDDRVHEADNHLLPGPGDLQDPIDDGLDYSDVGGGTILLHLLSHTIMDRGPDALFSVSATYRMLTTGSAQGERLVLSPAIQVYPGEWTTAPLEPGDSALYEVYAELEAYRPIPTGDLVNTWLNLGTERYWTASATGFQTYIPLLLKLRRAGTTLIQETATIILDANADFTPP